VEVANTLCFTPVDGQEFYYYDEGEATQGTVVLLHGFPDTPRSFGTVAKELAEQGYRVLRPYLPGYAPSRWQGPFDVRTISQRIAKFLEALDAGPVFFVGHDWGAVLGYSLLSQRPDLFLSGVTISVPHPLFALDPKKATLSQALQSAYILFFQLPWIPEALAQSSRVKLVSKIWREWSPSYRAPREAMEEIEQCLVDSGSAPFSYYRSLVSSLRTRPSVFAAIELPLLYLHGQEDGCLGAEYASGQENFFRGTYREQILSGVGHFVQAEAPLRLAQVLGEWFREER
jgi:pimeloyl-ACP methyl ester carboxylesterase